MTPSEAVQILSASGLSEAAIATAAGTSQPSINRIKRGAVSPGYQVGKALVALAKKANNKRRTNESKKPGVIAPEEHH